MLTNKITAMYNIEVDAMSNSGIVRNHNEDMILVQSEYIRDSRLDLKMGSDVTKPLIFAVADGMGGHNGGEFASELVVQNLDDFVGALPLGLDVDSLKNTFESWIKDMHNLVTQKGIDFPEFHNMGTTLVGLLVYEDKFYWLNVGDSRIYRYRNGILTQLSTDHSLAQVLDGKAPSNVIYNSVGAGQDVFIDFEEIPVILDQDVFMLCSDGISDMISDNEIENLMSEKANSEQFVNAANAAGGRDNISVVFLTISKEEEKAEDEAVEEMEIFDENEKKQQKMLAVPKNSENTQPEKAPAAEEQVEEPKEEKKEFPEGKGNRVFVKKEEEGIIKKLGRFFSK